MKCIVKKAVIQEIYGPKWQQRIIRNESVLPSLLM